MMGFSTEKDLYWVWCVLDERLIFFPFALLCSFG